MPGGRRVLEAVVGLQLEAGVEQAQIHLCGHADEPDCSPALLRQRSKAVKCVSVRGCVSVPQPRRSCAHCLEIQSALPERTRLTGRGEESEDSIHS